jgi:hypothetical protein
LSKFEKLPNIAASLHFSPLTFVPCFTEIHNIVNCLNIH